MIYDGTSCTKQMTENKDYLYALNVSLPDYFEKVQHYLDCAAYENEYEFPILYEKKHKFMETAKKCLDDFDEEATSLSPQCNQMCQHINVANFSSVFESDHVYITNVVDTFDTMAIHAIEINEQRRKNEFNEVSKITKDSEQEVKGVGTTEKAKIEEKERIAQEKLDARLERERLERERLERERKAREAAAAAAAARRNKPKKKKPWWKFWAKTRKLANKEDEKKLRKLIKGKNKKTSLKIAKKFMRKVKAKNRKLEQKKKSWKKLSKKLIHKHMFKSSKHGKRRWRILQAEPAKPPPKGPPKDPEHEALLKKMKEVYDQIEFMFNKSAPGVVKTADLPLDIDSFSKTFLYGQGINIYLYAKSINVEISRTDLLAILNGTKLGDAMENRIRQVLDQFSDDYKAALAMALDTSFIFNLGTNDTTIAEGEVANVPEHYMPVECFSEGCADDTPAEAAASADAAAKESEAKEGDKPAEPAKAEEKKAEPAPAPQSRILQMDKGFDELEGLFDLKASARKKEILF